MELGWGSDKGWEGGKELMWVDGRVQGWGDDMELGLGDGMELVLGGIEKARDSSVGARDSLACALVEVAFCSPRRCGTWQLQCDRRFQCIH